MGYPNSELSVFLLAGDNGDATLCVGRHCARPYRARDRPRAALSKVGIKVRFGCLGLLDKETGLCVEMRLRFQGCIYTPGALRPSAF